MTTGARRSFEDGRDLVTRFKESRLTQRRFAVETGVTVSSLQYWLRRVASDEGDSSKARFVELSARPGFGDGRVTLSVQIGGDITMRFETLPAPAYLAELTREMKAC
jgi:hypothetical protein